MENNQNAAAPIIPGGGPAPNPVGMAPAPATPYAPVQGQKQKSNAGLVIGIVLGVCALFIIGFIVLFVVVFSAADKAAEGANIFRCEYDGGYVELAIKDNKIVKTKTVNVDFDHSGESSKLSMRGIDKYTKDYAEEFAYLTSGTGTCKLDGVVVGGKESEETNNTNSDKKTVGSAEFGYVDVPSDWNKFFDPDATDVIQYSKGIEYIVTLYAYNKADTAGLTAEDVASNYMSNKMSDPDVEGVTGATVTVGKNNTYVAYQVYMHYKTDDTYLVTYWFQTEDDVIHYIAIEGGNDLADYTWIPESFSLTNN